MLKIDFSKNVKFCNFFSVKLSCHKFRQFSSSVKMADVEKAKLKAAIELYYTNNKSKDKKNDGILKQRVYEGNWSANSREQLIRRIKKCISEMDMDIIIKMFDNLGEKIQQAHEYGLDSLL